MAVEEMEIDIEERITERMNRSRLEVELKRAAKPVIITLLGIAGAVLGWLFLISNISKSVYTGHHEVQFMVADATGVVPGRADIRVRGIDAGKITKSELKDGHAVLTAQIYNKYGKIYRDAHAVLRPNTPLQDMYLDIVDRGTAAAGVADAKKPLAIGQTDTSVNVADVLNVFNPEARANLQNLLTDLGAGLNDHGQDLRQVFVEAVPFIQAASRVTDEISVRNRRTKHVIHNFNLLTSELGRRQLALRQLARNGGATLTALEQGSDNLDATLRELPPTLRQLDTSFAAVRGVLPEVNDAVDALKPVANNLPQSLSSVRSLADTADPAVRALRQPVRALVPLTKALKPAASSLSGALTALVPQLGAIDHIIKSTSGCTLGLYQFFQNTASVVKMGDSRGNYPRGNAVLSIASANGTVRDPDQFPAAGCAPGKPKTNQP